VNSVLGAFTDVALLTLPFILKQMSTPVKAATKYEAVDIYRTFLRFPVRTKDGRRWRWRRPFAHPCIERRPTQVLQDSDGASPGSSAGGRPQTSVTPTLLGPPELKLPQMAMGSIWAIPNGVLGPASMVPVMAADWKRFRWRRGVGPRGWIWAR